METMGGVVSGATFEVVNANAALVVVLPAVSCAFAANVCAPLRTVALFHVME